MRFTGLVAFGSLFLISLGGCRARNEFQAPPPPTVTVAQPRELPVVEWVEFTGSTKATASVEVRSRVKGYLEQIAFEDGAVVNANDLLFVIDKAPFLAALEAAEANLAKARAATQLADTNLRRTTQLVAERAVSKQQLDVDTAELDTAKANERAALANVTQARLDLGYTEIRAPMKGRIGRHLVDKGNLVLPDQSLLAILESIDPIHAYFSVSERDLLRFMEMLRNKALPDPEKEPPRLFMALGDEGDFSHVGVLDFRQPGIDPGTGTTLRRGIFENESLELLPGMFVRIRAALGDPRPRVLVEERAIGADQRGDFVLVVNDRDLVEYRPVKLGTKSDGMRIVLEGLQANEWIIVNGLQRARPGSPVTREVSTQVAEASPQAPGKAPEPANAALEKTAGQKPPQPEVAAKPRAPASPE
jgi:RND family efflux transporter MFP subunit